MSIRNKNIMERKRERERVEATTLYQGKSSGKVKNLAKGKGAKFTAQKYIFKVIKFERKHNIINNIIQLIKKYN